MKKFIGREAELKRLREMVIEFDEKKIYMHKFIGREPELKRLREMVIESDETLKTLGINAPQNRRLGSRAWLKDMSASQNNLPENQEADGLLKP